MRAAPRRYRIALVAIACALACGATAAFGETGTRILLPTNPMKPTAKGLRLSVDCRWVQGFGYRPVTIEATCTPPSVADRTLSVELQMSYWSPDHPFVTANAEIEIPAGSTRVARVVSVLQQPNAQYFKMNVYEDGLLIEDLSLGNQAIQSRSYLGEDTETVRMLFIANQAPVVSQLAFLANDPYRASPAINLPSDVASFDWRSPNNLTDDWLHYSALDVVTISLDMLKGLPSPRWEALRAWVRGGGNLCVFGVGSNWQGLEELEQRLACPASEKETNSLYRGWEPASNLVFENQVIPTAQAYETNQLANSPGAVIGAQTSPATPPAAPKTPPFVWKPAAFGMVVAMESDKPFPGDKYHWRWMLESLGPNRTRWHMRNGAIPNQDNPQFNDFLIADVGLPPIRTYRVLITLFVVAIGPVNYWLLRRSGRLHLFLFTVPLAALVTSGTLLGYALLADGLESRLRSRSLTYLDQQSEDAVSRARLSYYVGLAPSGGLTFSSQTAITPMELSPQVNPMRTRNQTMSWDDKQHLTRGWLGSRMPTQYVTTRADKCQRKLVPVPSNDASRLTVKNQLGVEIKQLLCCDAAGKLHLGRALARDQQATLDLISGQADLDATLVQFSYALTQHAPAFPGTIGAFESRGGWFFFGRRSSQYYAQQGGLDSAQSLLENELARVKTAVLSQHLEPDTYVAIVARPEEIEAGIDGLTESQSLHVIFGRW